MSRRRFLVAAGMALSGPWGLVRATCRRRAGHWLGACSDTAGRHFLAGIGAESGVLFRAPLPGRAHGVTLHPDGATCMVVARRPGQYLLRMDAVNGTLLEQTGPADGRHYYGHGAFDPTGRLFYTTENAFDEQGRGVVGVYDTTQGLRRVGELSSHGIGPHELRLMPDGTTLAVANGGILTHPDTGRTPLNLPDMRPSLAYVDRRDGRLLEELRPPTEWQRLSIRHLDIAADGRVAIAAQYQGPTEDPVPLVALHRRGQALQWFSLPPEQQGRLRQYCGSIRFDRAGRWLAVSAPRGNLVVFLSLQGEETRDTDVVDGCGIAATQTPGEFLLSGGRGDLIRYRVAGGEQIRLALADGTRWDNHLHSS